MKLPTQGQPASVPTPEMAGDSDSAPDLTNGFCIEVRVDKDGQISVSVEPNDVEDAEESGAPGEGGGPDTEESQVVTSAREAAKLVVEIINAGGQMQDQTGNNDAMESGYKPGL